MKRINRIQLIFVISYFLIGLTIVYGAYTTNVIPISNSTYDIGNSTMFYRDLWLDRNIYIGGTLEVHGSSEFFDDVDITGILDVIGNINANGSVNATGNVTLGEKLKSQGNNSYFYYDNGVPTVKLID